MTKKERMLRQWTTIGYIALPFLFPVILVAAYSRESAKVVYSSETTEYIEALGESVLSLDASTDIFVGQATELESLTYSRDIQMSDEEFDLAARCVYAEADDYRGFDVQLAIAETIFNRIASDKHPDSVHDVIYEDGAYTVVSNGRIDRVLASTSAMEAVQTALETITYDTRMIYFQTDNYHGIGTPYMNIGNVYFSIQE